MIASTLLLSAVAALAPGDDPTPLTCDLQRADRSRFRLKGHFDKAGLHSNLSDLIRVEGEFVPAPPEYLVVRDGTENHRWRLGSRPLGQMFDASLTRYGSGAAILLVERHGNPGGRHWGRAFVGVGLCDVGTSRAGKEES